METEAAVPQIVWGAVHAQNFVTPASTTVPRLLATPLASGERIAGLSDYYSHGDEAYS